MGKATQAAAAEWVSPRDLRPWPGNPRHNDGAPVDRVAESIKRFGFAAPIVANRDGEIIAGHTRWKAAAKLGMAKVPVRYMDLSERDAHLLALADNRYTELTAWDSQSLAGALSGFSLDDAEFAGWDSKALEDLASKVADFGPLDDDGLLLPDNDEPDAKKLTFMMSSDQYEYVVSRLDEMGAKNKAEALVMALRGV